MYRIMPWYLYQMVTKNRYAGNVSWTDGEKHEPTLYIKGIELKQSRMPPIMKEVMGKTIDMILNNNSEEDVNNIIIPIIDSIVKEQVDVEKTPLPEAAPGARLLQPPPPIAQSEQNWPLLTVSRGFFDSAMMAAKKQEGVAAALAADDDGEADEDNEDAAGRSCSRNECCCRPSGSRLRGTLSRAERLETL